MSFSTPLFLEEVGKPRSGALERYTDGGGERGEATVLLWLDGTDVSSRLIPLSPSFASLPRTFPSSQEALSLVVTQD